MTKELTIRLSKTLREALEWKAQSLGVTLDTLVTKVVNQAAEDTFRERVRTEVAKLAEHLASSPEAREFFEFWGTPDWDMLQDDGGAIYDCTRAITP
ncbi:MAG TPA: hypothetical protein VJY39_11170 [Acidisphaera sp.]|nr:hypothetical protein [Acidisphaera sp.]